MQPKIYQSHLMATKSIYSALVAMEAFISPSFFSMLLRGGNQLSKSEKWLKYVKITHNNV
jgi:hypothetical protein